MTLANDRLLTSNWTFVMVSANGLLIAAAQASLPLLAIPVAGL